MNASATPTAAPSTHARTTGPTLRKGATLTAVAAVLFPRLNAVLHEGQTLWQLDTEAAVLIPVIVAATFVLFATVGRWGWRSTDSNRTADVALATAGVSVLAIVAFWISAPIVLGGLAATLGLESRRRAPEQGKGKRALTATTIGLLAFAAGAAIWLAGA